jgi:hypothetical protein
MVNQVQTNSTLAAAWPPLQYLWYLVLIFQVTFINPTISRKPKLKRQRKIFPKHQGKSPVYEIFKKRKKIHSQISIKLAVFIRELLQIKSLHYRCKRMETIIVSWQNGIRFSVKRKLSLHNSFPSNLSWNKYIVSNWRYRCNTVAILLQYHYKIVFKAFLPKRFATRFYPLQTINSLQVDRFESVVISVVKSLLHKRRVETFLSVSAGFSLQIRFKQKVATDIIE